MSTYYVDPVSGNDANAGTSLALAFKSTQKAADTAVAGDTVYLCATGVESITAKIDLDTNAGSSGSPISFIAANGSGVRDGTQYEIKATAAVAAVLDFAAASDFTVWERVKFNGNSTATVCLNVALSGSDGHSIKRCEITGATSHGISGRGVGWTIIGCDVHHNGGSGIFHTAVNAWSVDITTTRLRNNTGDGWNQRNAGSTIRQSEIYANGGKGINFSTSSSNGVTVSDCTIYGNASDGVDVSLSTAGGFIFRNVSFAGNGTGGTGYAIRAGSASKVASYSYCHNNGNASGESDVALSGTDIKTGSPLFASTTAGSENFTPQTGSPLINNGQPTPWGSTTIGAVQPSSGGSGGGVSLARVMGGL